MAWTKEQKDLQRKSFERWKSKNMMSHKSGFRKLPHKAGERHNQPARGSETSVKDELPEMDHKKVQTAIEEVLEKYRLFKSNTFEEREVNNDQAAAINSHNVNEPEVRRSFCDRVERAVNKLYPKEKYLVTERYMTDNHVTDIRMYTDVMPMSSDTYAKIRRSAFYRLAFNLDHLKIINITELVVTNSKTL